MLEFTILDIILYRFFFVVVWSVFIFTTIFHLYFFFFSLFSPDLLQSASNASEWSITIYNHKKHKLFDQLVYAPEQDNVTNTARTEKKKYKHTYTQRIHKKNITVKPVNWIEPEKKRKEKKNKKRPTN